MKYIILCFLFIPTLVLAGNLKITEIMFDPEGSDAGREWIEIFNGSEQSINLSDLKFFENDTNHGVSGDVLNIQPNQYVVIADNPTKFKEDFVGFSGILLDSTFSLVNTGEYLALKLKTGEILDELTYDTQKGGNGTGNSIQLNSSGDWIPALPTPSKENSQTAVNESEEEKQEVSDVSEDTSSHIEQEEISDYEYTSDLKIGIGRDRVASINSPIEFEIRSNRKVYFNDVDWNFGDGSEIESGIKADHIYEYPGNFVVIGSVSKKERNNNGIIDKVVARGLVEVYEPQLSLYLATSSQYILTAVIRNESKREVNLGEWIIDWGEKGEKIPSNTILLPNMSLKIPLKDIEYLDLDHFDGIALLYPNSYWYNSFKWMH